MAAISRGEKKKGGFHDQRDIYRRVTLKENLQTLYSVILFGWGGGVFIYVNVML